MTVAHFLVGRDVHVTGLHSDLDREGEIVFVFTANATPNRADILKYYYNDNEEDMMSCRYFRRHMKPFPFDRLVIKQSDGYYLIVPFNNYFRFEVS